MDSSLRSLLIDKLDTIDLSSCSWLWGCWCSSFDDVTLVSCRKHYSNWKTPVKMRSDRLRFFVLYRFINPFSVYQGIINAFSADYSTLIFYSVLHQAAYWYLIAFIDQLDHVMRCIDKWKADRKNNEIGASCSWLLLRKKTWSNLSTCYWRHWEREFLPSMSEKNLCEIIELWRNSLTEEVKKSPMLVSSFLKYCSVVDK